MPNKHEVEPSLSDAISPAYQKFFAKFPEIETLPVEQWRIVHLLAFLCQRYKQYYNLDFTFSFKGSPSKCREVFEINKLGQMLSSDPKILKDYIGWVFDKKVIERKKRITSLGYFTHPEIVNEYKFKFLFTKKEIKRTDALPANVVDICNQHGFSDITTYMALAFVKKMPNQDKLMLALKEIGFDVEVLDKIA